MFAILVILEHLAYIRLRESQHGVELLFGTNVPANIKAACQVVQCDGADAHHKDAVESTLELFESITVKNVGMGEGVINVFAMLVQYHISEVVVLIDDEIEGIIA